MTSLVSPHAHISTNWNIKTEKYILRGETSTAKQFFIKLSLNRQLPKNYYCHRFPSPNIVDCVTVLHSQWGNKWGMKFNEKEGVEVVNYDKHNLTLLPKFINFSSENCIFELTWPRLEMHFSHSNYCSHRSLVRSRVLNNSAFNLHFLHAIVM